ncbi:MAG: hypothetical protein CFH06_01045 [Alphaproteobacteria bacterium MarineAlpha3_Bin5]|nr:hypothetical protein [Magnetovibrio sp.]PPR77926.1 MAG: hypothetical protein CFH06_01045 [Alphaproteobacteria bacterium MarineAlpha3_Bin5]
MCTFVILRRPKHCWPVLIAANRDEMANRSWQFPSRHWQNQLNIVGGLDEDAGGTWLAINDRGLISGILNRKTVLRASAKKTSRGKIPLEALGYSAALDAANALCDLNPKDYNPFNLIIIDANNALWLRAAENASEIEVRQIPEGFSMITEQDLNDIEKSVRIKKYLPQFKDAKIPNPGQDDWQDWETILADTSSESSEELADSMFVNNTTNFCTVSSSLLALPIKSSRAYKPIWRFNSFLLNQGEYSHVLK